VRYTRTHEWIEPEEDGMAAVGISSRAQQIFGEVVFVELPEEGEEFDQEDPLGNIETVDGEVVIIHSPITGEVVEINSILENSPDLVNKSPEGDGWFVKMRMETPKEIGALMTADEYEDYEEEVIDEEEDIEDEEEYF
jgi:glycine cleavage system H protein